MIRLDRWLAALALGSRSQVQQLVRQGDVTVNGAAVRDPGRACDEAHDSLAVRGRTLDGRLTRHVMLHKPAGRLTAARDSRQPTVMDLLPPVYAGIGCMPVGRLDKDTTGLLLLTTDGELSHRLLAPKRHVDKVYLAGLDAPADTRAVQAFASGLDLGGFTAAPALLEPLDGQRARVTIHEGKFHQVKRMFEAVGLQVITLHRLAFGPLELDAGLAPGGWRELTADEERAIRQAAGQTGDRDG